LANLKGSFNGFVFGHLGNFHAGSNGGYTVKSLKFNIFNDFLVLGVFAYFKIELHHIAADNIAYFVHAVL